MNNNNNDTSNRGLGSPNMDPDTKHDIQSKGGTASSQKQDMSELGRMGGQSQGAWNNPGNFANRSPEDVEDAARKGGRASHEGDDEEDRKDRDDD